MPQEQSEIALMMPTETTTLEVKSVQELGSLDEHQVKSSTFETPGATIGRNDSQLKDQSCNKYVLVIAGYVMQSQIHDLACFVESRDPACQYQIIAMESFTNWMKVVIQSPRLLDLEKLKLEIELTCDKLAVDIREIASWARRGKPAVAVEHLQPCTIEIVATVSFQITSCSGENENEGMDELNWKICGNWSIAEMDAMVQWIDKLRPCGSSADITSSHAYRKVLIRNCNRTDIEYFFTEMYFKFPELDHDLSVRVVSRDQGSIMRQKESHAIKAAVATNEIINDEGIITEECYDMLDPCVRLSERIDEVRQVDGSSCEKDSSQGELALVTEKQDISIIHELSTNETLIEQKQSDVLVFPQNKDTKLLNVETIREDPSKNWLIKTIDNSIVKGVGKFSAKFKSRCSKIIRKASKVADKISSTLTKSGNKAKLTDFGVKILPRNNEFPVKESYRLSIIGHVDLKVTERLIAFIETFEFDSMRVAIPYCEQSTMKLALEDSDILKLDSFFLDIFMQFLGMPDEYVWDLVFV